MERNRPPSSHGFEIAIGLAIIGLRLLIVYAVIWAGYLVYAHFGVGWFKVYVFSAIAAGLHFELKRIDREYPPDGHDGA